MADNQILTFRLGEEHYGLGILAVQEIRGWTAVTRIPHAPPQILGVLNLRGAIVPIIDLRLRFGQANPVITPLTVIIVLSIGSGAQRRDCGLVVDAVSDVVELPADSVRPAPPMQGCPEGACVDGIATIDDRMVILLNLEALVSQDLPASSHASPGQAAA